jgi:hypothetical protein
MNTGATFENLRGGTFLTRERVRLVALVLVAAYAIGLAYLVLTANGPNDRQGRPLGTDFSNVYAAGTYVLEGRPQAPFDPALQYAREQSIFGAATPFYGWHYPPFFLFIAAALASLPYLSALALWQGVTLALYLVTIRAILARAMPVVPAPSAVPHHAAALPSWPDPLWLLLALAFPAVFVNLGHGHNGFLTAALLGAALAVLDRRPVLAGILFALLVYKPQFGLMVPLVLVASGRWRAFAAGFVTVAVLFLLTTLAFGTPVWAAFLVSLHFTRTVVLEQGETGWHKIQSMFAWVRMWGGPIALAYAVQVATALGLAVALVWLWRRDVDFALKAAALVIATILATPYSLDYDMTALAPAIAFLAVHGLRCGFADYEKSAVAALWFAPLLARTVAQQLALPLGVLAMATVLGLVLHRAIDAAADRRPHPAARLPAAAAAVGRVAEPH